MVDGTVVGLPFAHPHVALMADGHLGRGATVGSVIPTERAIIPAAVGVDIGCGMIAVRTRVDRGHAARGGSAARAPGGHRGRGAADRDLAGLPEGTEAFDRYVELRWAQEFALLKREKMMDRVVAVTAAHVGEPVVEAERINCHHNVTEVEEHAGRAVWVSRKGAIRARRGEAGLIPGSMGRRRTSSSARVSRCRWSPARTGRGGRCPGRPRASASRSPSCARR